MVLESSLYPVRYLGRLYAVGDDTWNVGDEMTFFIIFVCWAFAIVLHFTGLVEHPAYFFLFGYITAELAEGVERLRD